MAEVIEALENSSGYTFLYSDSQIKPIRHLKVDFNNAEINEVLDHCLRNTGMTYQIEDHTIIIVPRDIKYNPDKVLDMQDAVKPELYFGLEGEIKD